MDVNIWSIEGAKWHIHGKDKYLVLENYPLHRGVKHLPDPFLPVVDVYGKEVLIDFFAGHLLPFHYLRVWGERARESFISRLSQALEYDIARVEGYTLKNIVFSEGKVYILPPQQKGYTLEKVINDLRHYLNTYGVNAPGGAIDIQPIDPGIIIRRGIYHLEKPFSMNHIVGLMRRLVIWGYYPILSISPSEFMEGSRFMRSLAFYMPWAGKTSIYDMVPAISLVMGEGVRINIGMSGIVERVLNATHAEKVAFITIGMPKVKELYSLVEKRDIIIYTDEDADVSISLSDSWQEASSLDRILACQLYAVRSHDDNQVVWEDSRLLADIPCVKSTVSEDVYEDLDADALFTLWQQTRDRKALVKAIWKDRHEYKLVSHQMYDALASSGLINRKGFYSYLVHGTLKKGIADMFAFIPRIENEDGLGYIYSLIGQLYLGDIPEKEEVLRLLRRLKEFPPGRLLWFIFFLANYISRTGWEENYEEIHHPLMDFMYMDPYEGMDKWLFLTAKNAFAITYMHSGNLNEAYSIISSIVPQARKYRYFDLLFKVYNNLAILSSEVSPRLASKYLLFSTMYALVSGGTSLGGVFSSLLTEEVQRAPLSVLRRIYEVGWSIPLDDMQEFVLLATWIWVLVSRGHIKEAEKYMRVLERKYQFPTGDIVRDVEYYYLKLSYFLLRGNVGKAKDMAENLLRLLESMPITYYRPDIYKRLAVFFFIDSDYRNLDKVVNSVKDRYGEESLSYMMAYALKIALAGNVYGAIDILKDVYRKNLHVWKLLDAAEASFLIGDLYCRLDKGKIASVYYRKAEVLLTRLGALRLLRFMLSRHDVCVNIDTTSDFHRRMVMFSGDARMLMEEMYSLILDLESENFFLDRILDMFSMITDVASLDVLLERMLAEILHIMPGEKGYIATVGGEHDVWVSYSLDGRNPARHEFAFAPEDVVRRGGVFASSPSAIGEVEFIGKEHLVVYLQNDTGIHVFSDMDEYFLIKLMEIIRVAVLMESLGSVSVRDKLTDLYARWYGMKRGSEEFEKARRGIYPVSVLYMDLDGFKEINDTYGHGIGDKVLAHVGSLIRESVRYMDIPFRYGGDEFIVVLPATSIEGATEVAKRIVDAIFRFFEKYPYKVSISVGVSSYPEDEAESFEDLMKVADERLYKAKKLGKNRYYTGREEK
ncbi:diguanylate cyclase [bacterium 3DAC]|nr:diguanylate cyclase [bacterium 3DAC]